MPPDADRGEASPPRPLSAQQAGGAWRASTPVDPDRRVRPPIVPPQSLLEINEQLVRTLIRTQVEVEEAASAAREAERLGGLDPLTGLPTRARLVDRFAQAAALADRHEGRLALLFVDLDGFKQVNDLGGHGAGDRLLVAVARCLVQSVRAADTVSRHGGDEFIVLLTGVGDRRDVVSSSAKILKALAGLRGDGVVRDGITGSIGISLYPDDGDDVRTLIDRADAAMYCAKRSGPGRSRFYGELAAGECRARALPAFPLTRGRRASDAPTHEAGLHDDLVEINTALMKASIRARDKRDRAEHHLRVALDAAAMGRWELDLKSGEFVRSVRHDRIFGHADLLPRWDLATALERFVPEDRAAVAAALHDARTTGSIDLERRIHHAGDRSIRWLHVRGETVYANGVPLRIVGVVADVTERRAAEEQARQAQKMEAVGQLTGGIAHDFNNLLLVIGGSVELLASRLPVDDRTDRLVASIRRAVVSGGRLNEHLLAFARRQDLKPEVTAIERSMPVFDELLRRAANESIVVETSCEAAPWPCYVDAHQLEIGILNLAINARDAMPGGGALALRVGNRLVDDAEARRWGARGGEYLVVAVADTGAGMPDDVIERAFDPFFTTKPVGQGTGLGLSQVYGFAKQAGGFVGIERGAALGTTVSIHLPRSHRIACDEPMPDGVEPPLERGSGTVLVVEDDREVRATATALLLDLGYAVLEAETADAALAIIGSGARVDVVFSDVVLHGLDGIHLAIELRRRFGDMPILLTSGYGDRKPIPDDLAAPLHVLHKPYGRAELAAALRQALPALPALPVEGPPAVDRAPGR